MTDSNDVCEWGYFDDAFIAYWYTSCQNSFTFNEGTPKENEFLYCPFCGKRISEGIIAEAEGREQ